MISSVPPPVQLKDYQFLHLIGEGGYGWVFEAIQKSTGQKVAIKVLKLDNEPDESRKKYQIARFERETQLCAQLSHPHIVTLLDKGINEAGTPYAVFEYIEGESLKDLIVRRGGLSAEETGELMGQVLDALAAAHARGIVHRDLKPHNIMVQQSGSQMHVKILDFGIGAFTRDFRGNDYQSLTLTREVMGTPAYSAPEQLRGEPATVKSDLYAWGLVTIECLTGIPVMRDDSVAEVFQQQLNGENIPLPPALAGHSLSEILRRVLHKNPRLRTGDAASLYPDFKKINFSTLVGNIDSYRPAKTVAPQDEVTAAHPLAWQDLRSEKRQITVLCINLSHDPREAGELGLEALDAIQKDQLNQVKDTAVRFGGHIAGSIANSLMIYFGYPTVTDNDARRAGRVALELMSEIRKRSALLYAQRGLKLNISIVLHSGFVLYRPNQLPEGSVPNATFDLLYQCPSGNILATESSKKLLEPYLEFESHETKNLAGLPDPLPTWAITGERQTEALSFLRPWSANREMVGREPEHGSLKGLWATVKGGQGQAMVLHGQAGIGKSKMVYEIKKEIRNDQALFREARCLTEYQNNALFPFLDMLRNHWGIAGLQDPAEVFALLKDRLNEAGADVEQGLPILCFWLSIPLPEGIEMPPVTPDVQKQMLFQLLKQAILHMGGGDPFMLVIEDLHWLDPTGRDFVEHLLNGLEKEPLLLLMTTRPVFIPDWQHPELSYLELHPLTESFPKTLIEAVLNGKGIESKALAYIEQRADGIPLYLEEMTRMLVEEGYLVLENEQYQFASETDIQAIPATLQDLLNARLDRLGPAKETAQIAGTIGREFDYDLLVHASLRDEASVQNDLEALMDADLVYRQRKVNGDSYIFRHALIRDAAYDGMLTAPRREHHLRIAETLKAHFPDTLEENPFEVARHLAGGEEYEEGSEYGIRAVERQVEINSHVEAEMTGNTIRNWIEKVPVKGEKIGLELTLNNVSIMARMAIDGYGNESVFELNKQNQSLLEALKKEDHLISDTELDKLAQKTEWTTYVYFHFANKREEASALGQKLLESFKDEPNPQRELGLLPLIAQGIHANGDLIGAEALFNRMLKLSDSQKDAKIELEYAMEPVSTAYFFMGQTRLCLGYPETAMDFMRRSIEEGEKTGHMMSITLGYTYLVWLAAHLEDFDTVVKYYQEFIEKYPEQQENLWVFSHLKMCGECVHGRTEYPKQYIQDILASGQHFSLSWYEGILASTYLRNGQAQKAVELMEESLKRSEKEGDGWTLPMVKRLLASSHLAIDPNATQKPEKLLKSAIKNAQKMQALWFELEALVALMDGIPLNGESPAFTSRLRDVTKALTEGHEHKTFQKAIKILNP